MQQVLVDLQVGDLVNQRTHSLGEVSRRAAEQLGAPRKPSLAAGTCLCIRAACGSEPGS